MSEDVLNRGTDLRFAGIGDAGWNRHRLAFRLLDMDARHEAVLFEMRFIALRAIGSVGQTSLAVFSASMNSMRRAASTRAACGRGNEQARYSHRRRPRVQLAAPLPPAAGGLEGRAGAAARFVRHSCSTAHSATRTRGGPRRLLAPREAAIFLGSLAVQLRELQRSFSISQIRWWHASTL